ncbi:MAG: hypothetical protein BRC29_01045 [Nanohaloarchaea archaeon SW_7_43_1]|nr:MAG: hypothetical protein BRC29_01045 [Nanohaloarchaea archaeon SW_7_43_1]
MGLLSGVKSFLLEKFWLPIIDETVFYNPFNTAVYSGLFALTAAYIGYPVIKKLDIDLNKEFFLGIAPFVFLGGAARGLKDINAVNTIILETPFIYLLMFGTVIASIILSRKLESKTSYSYHKILSAIGTVILLISLSFYRVNNFPGFAMITATLGTTMILGYSILKLVKPGFLKPEFYIPIVSHYFDAGITGIALMFPRTGEKHVLARFFIDVFGSLKGMYIMKSLIIPPAVYYILKNVEGDEKIYYLFLISVLGIAIATRNLLTFITLSG